MISVKNMVDRARLESSRTEIYPELRRTEIYPELRRRMAKVASEGAAAKVRMNLAEYLEKGIVK